MATLPSISSILDKFRPKTPLLPQTQAPQYKSLISPSPIYKSLTPTPTATSPILPTPTGGPITPTPFTPPKVTPEIKAPVTTPVKPIVPPVTPTLPQGGTETPPVTPTTPSGESSTPTTPVVSPATTKAVETAEKAVATAQNISPDELSTQEDLDKLIESAKSAYIGIKDKPIPLEFITGQLASVERRATALAEPLERKLARLQSVRTSALEASKFALERADKKQSAITTATEKEKTDAESARRFGIEQAGLAQTRALAEKKFEEDKRQFGLNYAQTQQKLDAADEKANKSEDVQDTADSLQLKVDLIDEIGKHQGLNSRVGPTALGRRAFAIADKFGAGQDFAGSVKQLASQEFLDKLINVKAKGATFGALTDREGDALRAAATKINDWEIKDEKGIGIGEWNIDEKSFKAELTKIQTLAKKALEKSGGVSGETKEEDQLREAGYTDEQIEVIKNS